MKMKTNRERSFVIWGPWETWTGIASVQRRKESLLYILVDTSFLTVHKEVPPLLKYDPTWLVVKFDWKLHWVCECVCSLLAGYVDEGVCEREREKEREGGEQLEWTYNRGSSNNFQIKIIGSKIKIKIKLWRKIVYDRRPTFGKRKSQNSNREKSKIETFFGIFEKI